MGPFSILPRDHNARKSDGSIVLVEKDHVGTLYQIREVGLCAEIDHGLQHRATRLAKIETRVVSVSAHVRRLRLRLRLLASLRMSCLR